MLKTIFGLLICIIAIPSTSQALTQRQVDWLLMVVEEARTINHEEIVEIAQTVLVLETLAGEWKFDPEGIKGDNGDSNGPFQIQVGRGYDILRWFPYLKRDFESYGSIITDEVLEKALLKDIRLNIRMGVHSLLKNYSRLKNRGYRGQELFELTVLSHKFGFRGALTNPNTKTTWYRVRAYEYLDTVVREFNKRMFKTYLVAKAF